MPPPSFKENCCLFFLKTHFMLYFPLLHSESWNLTTFLPLFKNLSCVENVFEGKKDPFRSFWNFHPSILALLCLSVVFSLSFFQFFARLLYNFNLSLSIPLFNFYRFAFCISIYVTNFLLLTTCSILTTFLTFSTSYSLSFYLSISIYLYISLHTKKQCSVSPSFSLSLSFFLIFCFPTLTTYDEA